MDPATNGIVLRTGEGVLIMSNANDFIIENGVLTRYVGAGGDVIIPETVTTIGREAFADNKTVTGVQMHDGVLMIEEKAFL